VHSAWSGVIVAVGFGLGVIVALAVGAGEGLGVGEGVGVGEGLGCMVVVGTLMLGTGLASTFSGFHSLVSLVMHPNNNSAMNSVATSFFN